MDRPTGSLPRVVRRTRPERRLVADDARVATDVLRALCVPEEIRDRIFSPLVSGREGGSGVGLSLAQAYVQFHQGMIECESRPGHTVFRILLPVA